MENYIVRIYRFQKDNPRHLVGIVESVEGKTRGKRAFTNIDDLWEILNSQMSETTSSKEGGKIRGGQGICTCVSTGNPEETDHENDC